MLYTRHISHYVIHTYLMNGPSQNRNDIINKENKNNEHTITNKTKTINTQKQTKQGQ